MLCHGVKMWVNLVKDQLSYMPYIKALGLIVSEEKLWKTDKPRGGAILGPGVIIFRNLKENHPRNIPVKYCRNWPSSFRGEDFLRFSYKKTDKPSGGATLGLGVIHFMNLKEDHPRNMPYIKALGLIVSEEKIFLRCSWEKLISSGAGLF